MVNPKTSTSGREPQVPGLFQQVEFWKAMAIGFTGVYLFKALKANGGSFQNNPYGINLNTDLIVDKALGKINLPPHIAEKVKPVVKLTAALKRVENPTYLVDLHKGFARLDEMSWDELYARSQVVALGEEKVRILAPEDHLRLLCVHLLRHGAWRPLWLCDVAAAVENRPANFDWDRCLSRNRRMAEWVTCTIGLAHRLLKVSVDDTPVAGKTGNLPRWLGRRVLKHWSAPFPDLHPPLSYGGPLINYVRGRTRLLHALRKRWPDPIEATITVRGPLNRWPRLPFQIGHYAVKTGAFFAKLRKPLQTP